MQHTAEQRGLPGSLSPGQVAYICFSRMEQIHKAKNPQAFPAFFVNLSRLQGLKMGEGRVVDIPACQQLLRDFGTNPLIRQEMLKRLRAVDRHNSRLVDQTVESARILGVDEQEIGKALPNQPMRLDRRRFLTVMAVGAATIAGGSLLAGNVKGSPLSREPAPAAKPQAGNAVATETLPPAENSSVIKEVLKPFIEQAQRKRSEREKNDPDYLHSVNPELIKNRLNFLVMIYGENYESESRTAFESGTDLLISIDTDKMTYDLISFTSDTRAPEAEQALREQGKAAPPQKLDKPYKVGGFNLMRKTFEHATGLSIDFQIVAKEAFIQKLIDQCFGGSVELNIPFDYTADTMSYNGQIYPGGTVYKEGKNRLNGLELLRFMKAGEVGGYIPSKGPHQRMRVVFNALKAAALPNIVPLWQKFFPFIDEEIKSGELKLDFEQKLLPTIPGLLGALAGTRNVGTLDAGQSIIMMDPDLNGRGLQYIWNSYKVNPITKSDVDEGKYEKTVTGMSMEIPINGDPYAQDLVTGYWPSTRLAVENGLNRKAPPVDKQAATGVE